MKAQKAKMKGNAGPRRKHKKKLAKSAKTQGFGDMSGPFPAHRPIKV